MFYTQFYVFHGDILHQYCSVVTIFVLFCFFAVKLVFLVTLCYNYHDFIKYPGGSQVCQDSNTEYLWVCKRGEGGQHGFQLFLLCPQIYLPGCGWKGAEGESNFKYLHYQYYGYIFYWFNSNLYPVSVTQFFIILLILG